MNDREHVGPSQGMVAFGVMSLEVCSPSAAKAALCSGRRRAEFGVLLQGTMSELEDEFE